MSAVSINSVALYRVNPGAAAVSRGVAPLLSVDWLATCSNINCSAQHDLGSEVFCSRWKDPLHKEGQFVTHALFLVEVVIRMKICDRCLTEAQLINDSSH